MVVWQEALQEDQQQMQVGNAIRAILTEGGDPVIHELVHQINHQVFEAINEVYFYERIFNYAMDAIEKEDLLYRL